MLLAGTSTGDRYSASQREFTVRWPTAGTAVAVLFAVDLQFGFGHIAARSKPAENDGTRCKADYRNTRCPP